MSYHSNGLTRRWKKAPDVESLYVDNPLPFRTSGSHGPVSYPLVILGDAPVAYWRLGDALGSSTVADSSGNGHTGTVNGGITLGQTGAIRDGNTAALFDGSTGYVTIADNAALTPSVAVTLELWMYPTDNTDTRMLIDKYSASGFYLVRVGAELRFSVGYEELQFNPSAVNAWSHVVATYDGATLKLYLNGVLVQSLASVSGVASSSGAPVLLGSYNGLAQMFKGPLDNIALYLYALSPAQVAAHYAARIY